MAVFFLLFEPKASDSAHGLFLGPEMFPEDTLNLSWTDLVGSTLGVTLHQRCICLQNPRPWEQPTRRFRHLWLKQSLQMACRTWNLMIHP